MLLPRGSRNEIDDVVRSRRTFVVSNSSSDAGSGGDCDRDFARWVFGNPERIAKEIGGAERHRLHVIIAGQAIDRQAIFAINQAGSRQCSESEASIHERGRAGAERPFDKIRRNPRSHSRVGKSTATFNYHAAPYRYGRFEEQFEIAQALFADCDPFCRKRASGSAILFRRPYDVITRRDILKTKRAVLSSHQSE